MPCDPVGKSHKWTTDLFVFVRSQVHLSLDKRLRRENSGVVIRSSRSRARARGWILWWHQSAESYALRALEWIRQLCRCYYADTSSWEIVYILLVACFYCHSSVFFIRHLLSLFSWGLASKCCLAQLAICPHFFLSLFQVQLYLYI